MRGKERSASAGRRCNGITPAYAGKSSAHALPMAAAWDHPRVCGEKYAPAAVRPCRVGSPPRMRGKEALAIFSGVCYRITPAYAGKSTVVLRTRAPVRDHPRVCGEKFVLPALPSVELGSPPRMRGKEETEPIDIQAERITPAYAGKRLKKSHSTVSPVAIVPLFPSVCNRPVVSNGNPAERDAPLFLPAENTVPASPAYNLRSS